jgi:hypothetical protein
VFLFFLLNCFLVAAPFVKASSAIQEFSSTLGCPVQSHHESDSEKESSSFSTLDELSDCHLSLRNIQQARRLLKRKEEGCLSDAVVDRHADYASPSFSFLLRPAYYIFLFRYKLF